MVKAALGAVVGLLSSHRAAVPGGPPEGKGTMGEITNLDDASVVGDIRELVGEVTEDEAALMRTLTPADLPETAMVEHLADLVDLLATIRGDEAMADYVYAIAPDWDGGIEMLLLGGRVTTAFARYELEHRVLARVG